MILRSIQATTTGQVTNTRTLCKGIIVPAKTGGTVTIYDEVVSGSPTPEKKKFTFQTDSQVVVMFGANDALQFCEGIYIEMATADKVYFLVP